MPEEKYSKKFWELFRALPEELKDALFSEETSKGIEDACKKNEVLEKTGEIADVTGRVLLGLLPPDEFQSALEKELIIKKEKAKNIAREISRFVFYPVKACLEELYKIEIAPPAQPTGTTPPPGEKPAASPKSDTYREQIE